MSDLYDEIISQRGSLESLVAKIPGFRGYQESQARRTADTLLREHLAQKIDQCITKFIGIEKKILKDGGLSLMSDTRDVKGKMGLYKAKVNSAMPGYSGMWAQMKIGPEELEQIYSFDEAQLHYVALLDTTLDALLNAVTEKQDIESAIMEVDATVDRANNAFSLRDQVLMQFGDLG